MVAISIPAASHHSSNSAILSAAHAVPVTDIGEAVLASPSPISVTHHGYVPWVRETVEMTEESSLVDAVQQSAQIHRDITMVVKDYARQ